VARIDKPPQSTSINRQSQSSVFLSSMAKENLTTNLSRALSQLLAYLGLSRGAVLILDSSCSLRSPTASSPLSKGAGGCYDSLRSPTPSRQVGIGAAYGEGIKSLVIAHNLSEAIWEKVNEHADKLYEGFIKRHYECFVFENSGEKFLLLPIKDDGLLVGVLMLEQPKAGRFPLKDLKKVFPLFTSMFLPSIQRNLPSSISLSLKEGERQTLIDALEKTNWIQKDAANILGISRRSLNYQIKKHGITHTSWRKNR